MNKLKKVLSLMLAGVSVFTADMCLTACKIQKKDNVDEVVEAELTQEQIDAIVMEAFNKVCAANVVSESNLVKVRVAETVEMHMPRYSQEWTENNIILVDGYNYYHEVHHSRGTSRIDSICWLDGDVAYVYEDGPDTAPIKYQIDKAEYLEAYNNYCLDFLNPETGIQSLIDEYESGLDVVPVEEKKINDDGTYTLIRTYDFSGNHEDETATFKFEFVFTENRFVAWSSTYQTIDVNSGEERFYYMESYEYEYDADVVVEVPSDVLDMEISELEDEG